MKQVALFIPEDTEFGKVYHPANRIAVDLAGIAGTRRIPEDRLPYIRSLGFDVAETNGQPLPIAHNPKGYERRPMAEPKHILDEA